MLLTLLPTVKMFLSVDKTLEVASRTTSQNLGKFQREYLQWSSIIVKPSRLWFTVILLMTLELTIL